MNNFLWSLPTKIFFGLGESKRAGKILKGFGRKCLIVTSASFGKTGSRHSVLSEFISNLKNANVEYEIFSDIEPNPRTTTIDRAAEQAKKISAKYILAFGGGSVMDAAKCIALLAVNEGNCYDYAYKGSGKERKKFNHALPLVCVPTHAATSSETDSYAVVTDDATQRKIVVFGEPLLPAISIIDPELTYTVPARQTVDGAFDILTHVLETYFSSDTFSPIQDRFTESIAKTVVEMLPKVLENPTDATARSNISWCASLALCGILQGRDGGFPIHGLEHGLSAYTDVAHGRGLALLLPHKMLFDAEVIPQKIIQINKVLFGDQPGFSDKTPLDAIQTGLIPYMKKVGAYTVLSDIHIPAKSGINKTELIQKTVEHAMEVDGIWKLGQEPYLENIRPIFAKDAIQILKLSDSK